MDKKRLNQECILFFKEKIEQLEKESSSIRTESPDLISEYYSIIHHLIALQNKLSNPSITKELYTYAVDYFTYKEEMYDEEDVLLDFYQHIIFEKDYLMLHKIYNNKIKVMNPEQVNKFVRAKREIDKDIIDKYKDIFIIYHHLFRFDIALENMFGINKVSSVLKGEDAKKGRKQILTWISELEKIAEEDNILENFINILITYIQYRYCIIYDKEFAPSYLKLM